MTRREILGTAAPLLLLPVFLAAGGGDGGASTTAEGEGSEEPGAEVPAGGSAGPPPDGAIASRRSGDWGNPDTWAGGRVPGDGRIAYVSPGHVVTLREPATVGAGHGTAVMVGSGGVLVVASDLTLRGNLEYERGASVRVDPPAGGLGIHLDAPAGVTVRIAPLPGGAGTPSFEAAGDDDRRITIAATGGGVGRIDAAAVPSALVLRGVTLEGLGSAREAALTAESRDGGSIVVWRRLRAKDCGRLLVRCRAGGRMTIDGLDVRAPREGTAVEIDAREDKAEGGSRRLARITLASTSRCRLNFYARDLDLCRDLVLVNGSLVANGDRRNVIERLWLLATADGTYVGMAPNAGTTLRDSAIVTRYDNAHPVQDSGADAGVGANVVEGCVFDGDGFVGSDAGDCVLPSGEVVMRRNIVINKAGTIASLITRTGSITVVRNTAHEAFALTLGETRGHPNQCRAFRSNLVVRQRYAVRQRSAMVPQATFEYDDNVTFALEGDDAVGGGLGPARYAPWWASGPAYGAPGRGAGDREADPRFRDPSRTARSFDAANGGPGTLEHLAAEIVKLNGWDADGREAPFDDRYAVARFLAYVREGFTPTNPAVSGAGAVDVG